ncbi:MAG: enoyl-CoA hydratase-related protein [Leptospiraceae bacterium]|nr:enoyl-CoA hydratase-related protein [Leptospiraceae bacterium]MDW7976890.1 enoyl-CoA hydratase-related protein [Leptospiraceae bacterium]
MYVDLVKKGNYAILTLNREEALNALNSKVLSEIREAIRELITDPKMRGFIITGKGDKAFCAGADIKELHNLSYDDAEEFARKGHKTMNMIAGSDLISIAAINGYALGGGLELALACDIRIASKNAKMGLPETGLGIIPGFGGTQRLPRVVGKGIALEMIFSGESITADRAYEIGLVNYVVDISELLPKAEELMKKMLNHKGVEAQKIAKWLVHSGTELPLTASLEREVTLFAEMFTKKEPQIGIQAFLNKQKPNFEEN